MIYNYLQKFQFYLLFAIIGRTLMLHRLLAGFLKHPDSIFLPNFQKFNNNESNSYKT